MGVAGKPGESDDLLSEGYRLGREASALRGAVPYPQTQSMISDISSPARPIAALARTRYVTGHGSARQISFAYSEIVRSLENLPEAAMLRMTLRAQSSGLR